MTEIYLFRHGQTNYNKDKIFTGWLDPDINEEGIKECYEIAEQLKDIKPTKAYASDLKRSQHTLQVVLEGINAKDGVEIVIDPRIKERNYGDLNGKSKEYTEKNFPKEYPLWHRSYDVPPPNGESIKDVEKRVMEFLKSILPTLKKDDVVFISAHGNSLRPIRRYFEGLSIEEMCSFEHPRAKVYHYTI
ncbi:MAG: histidine phosphatase family protein [Candidatus Micrarchaeia archaeon]